MDEVWVSNAVTALHGLARQGTGVPLIVVPGVMASASDFVPVVADWGLEHPVLIVDRRGRGGSGPLGAGYSVDTEVSDLAAWMASVPGRVILVGWSYGATIALEAAARTPARVKAVVAYDPVLAPFAAEHLTALAAAHADERVRIINEDITGLPAEHVERLRHTEAWPHLVQMAGPLDRELRALNDFGAHHDWSAVRASLLVGEGSRGALPYGPAFDRAAALLPGAPVAVLPGHAHLAHVDDPPALGRALARLIDAV